MVDLPDKLDPFILLIADVDGNHDVHQSFFKWNSGKRFVIF